jgi:hypothetical protein
VRWRRIDLKRVIAERFGVDFHPRYVGKLLKKLAFSHQRQAAPSGSERADRRTVKKLPARARRKLAWPAQAFNAGECFFANVR